MNVKHVGLKGNVSYLAIKVCSFSLKSPMPCTEGLYQITFCLQSQYQCLASRRPSIAVMMSMILNWRLKLLPAHRERRVIMKKELVFIGNILYNSLYMNL